MFVYVWVEESAAPVELPSVSDGESKNMPSVCSLA